MPKALPSFLNPLRQTGFRVGWVGRVPEINTEVERAEAVARLLPVHHRALGPFGASPQDLWLCEQVHGRGVERVQGASGQETISGVDGLTTNDPKCVLGVYVADCGALYIGDPIKSAAALLHSGKKGTELNILAAGITKMVEEYGSKPSDLIVVLSPCIRPPVYEVDFAAQIRDQALAAGVHAEHYHDAQICTTSDPEAYYSYRQEDGMTGRMLALMTL